MHQGNYDDDTTRRYVTLVKGTPVSHYRIIERIGRGGMGEVFLAEDTKLKRCVALKFLLDDYCSDQKVKTLFTLEAQAAARVDHPNVVTVHEVGEYRSRPYFAMQYVDGLSLRDVIKARELSYSEIVDIAMQICQGLQHAHDSGLVHRDIKPSNIRLDREKRPIILDFGLAKSVKAGSQARNDTTAGTIGYMSPEQILNAEVDRRSDIFSLGVVLYELTSGKAPFRKETAAETADAILNDAPEPLELYRPGVPAYLGGIIRKALDKDPAMRYQSAAGLLADLKRLHMTFREFGGSTSPASASQPSIAVLPPVNLSADPEQEYFCDGIAEEVINGLTHIKGLRVVARTSAFAFKGKQEDVREIGRRLNVQTVLEGSVRRFGSRVRITAQLIDVTNGYHMWSERYDRELEDVFAIQDEVTQAIVDNLRVRLVSGKKAEIRKRRTENPKAHHLYLKGRFFWNKRTEKGLKKALGYFQEAILEDPEYAIAYSGLADTYCMFYPYKILSPSETYPKAKKAALKALELDDRLAEAHASLGQIKHKFERDLEGAESEFRMALSLNPGYAGTYHWYSIVLSKMGRFDEALRNVEHALELDPLSTVLRNHLSVIKSQCFDWDAAVDLIKQCMEIDPANETIRCNYAMLLLQLGRVQESLKEIERARALAPEAALVGGLHGTVLYYARRYDDAISQMQATIDVTPFSDLAHLVLGQAYMEKGMLKEALAELRKGRELAEDSGLHCAAVSLLGVANARLGNTARARESLTSLLERSSRTGVSYYWLAILCFDLKEIDNGFCWLERAFEKRDRWLRYLKVHPLCDRVRSDERFLSILERMGLMTDSAGGYDNLRE